MTKINKFKKLKIKHTHGDDDSYQQKTNEWRISYLNSRPTFMELSRNYFPLTWGNFILKINNYEIKTYCTSIRTHATFSWYIFDHIPSTVDLWQLEEWLRRRNTGTMSLGPRSSKFHHLIITVVLGHSCFTWTHPERMWFMCQKRNSGKNLNFYRENMDLR